MTEKQTLQFVFTDGTGAKHMLSMPYALPDLPQNVLMEAASKMAKLNLFAKGGAKIYVKEKAIQYVTTSTTIVSEYK